MSTFATELSGRFLASDKYWALLETLQAAGVNETLGQRILVEAPTEEELAKLLYCAEVFVQTADEEKLRHAQEIAIQTLLVTEGATERERAMRLLTELGNFPSLRYAELRYTGAAESLFGMVNRRVSEQLNTVRIGDESLPLTDYQRGVWAALPKTPRAAVTAPTSAGKSFLVLEHLCRKAESSHTFTAVYVTPTRALLAEVLQKVQVRLKGDTSIRVSAVPALSASAPARQIFVLTQERLNVLLAADDARFKLDMLVVDEAQNLAEDARGMILQDCLERIASRHPNAQVILLAPGATGMPDVARTFGVSDLVPLATQLSPVLQNRIVLTKNGGRGKTHELSIALMGREGARRHLGSIRTRLSLERKTHRLATVALELSGDGKSLLYETGAREAEKTAALLVGMLEARNDRPRSASLGELAKFIREHIHPEYQLAGMVQCGVAYHYGKMPNLLREALEQSFKQDEGGLQFLVCTTTLAQGVNLPARNVFIDTPKRGQGKPLPPALLWNFAGRAGRLNHDIVGNIFLLNYEEWDSKPMDKFVPFDVKPAITETIRHERLRIVEALRDGVLPPQTPGNEDVARVRACAGLLMSHVARRDVYSFLGKVMDRPNPGELNELAHAAELAYSQLELPDYIVAQNWTVDPFGLRRLYEFILAKIEQEEIDELIPMNPHVEPSGHYKRLFGFLVERVHGKSRSFGALAGGLAVQWMKGLPYPVMLKGWLRGRRMRESSERRAAGFAGTTPPKERTLDAHILDAFRLIEDVVRFEFVQLAKAYRDLLLHALRETGNDHRIPDVEDFALYLELGISTVVGTAYVELGLSRIAASVLEGLDGGADVRTAEDARRFLSKLDLSSVKVGPIIQDELTRLGLTPAQPSGEEMA